MANNRLYIKDPETGSRMMIAKSAGSGWYVCHGEIDEWFNLKDVEASYDMCPGKTTLVLESENVD